MGLITRNGTTCLRWQSVDQVAWGNSISLGVTSEEKRQIDPTWKAMFQALGETQASIDKQITYAESWRPMQKNGLKL